MDAIEKELDKLTNGGANLSKSIKDIGKCLEILMDARTAIENDPTATVSTLQALESQLKAGFQLANDSLKGPHGGITKYGKALDKKFKHSTNENTFGALANRQPLINRAIQMHLLREGNFEIAETFAKEAGIVEGVPSDESSWQSIIESFTTEFCALLRLSAESPLYVATTAGAIALPTFNKMATIMKAKKTEWTSQNELPVEVPLPDKFKYHSIFVCPVSKEQTTDSNPPMMIPCGHVLAKDTVQKLARGTGSR
ncbi:hypothetical protein TWF788_009753 [Orbilia oligospora]|uniref:GID complex catalytic subunit 2 n=1 Tax=Orbilia oligospora TaxID=2813651 RepID=A0A7C8U0N8_ORBOL|nr:hypothetical protein TWF788_009753 [Orbilia oligospora]